MYRLCTECLIARELTTAEFTATTDDYGEDWWEYDGEGYANDVWYECPKCKAVLFRDEDSAVKFLLQEGVE